MRQIKYSIFLVVILLGNVLYSTAVFASSDIDMDYWAYPEIVSFSQEESYIWQDSGEKDFEEPLSIGEMATVFNHMWRQSSGESESEELWQMQQQGYLLDMEDVNDTISREEISLIICRFLALDYEKEEKTSFNDDEDISEWAKGYIATLQKKKIVIGYPNKEFRPNQNITKAEFITMMNRCKSIYGEELITEDSGDISYLEIGIVKNEGEKVVISTIEDALVLQSGDGVILSIALPKDAQESKVFYTIGDANVVEYDEELNWLTALKEGKTTITFYTEEGMYRTTQSIIVK